MCISKGASLRAVLLVLLSSYVLLQNKEHQNQNKVLAYFFIFITMIQAIDYMIWRDLECQNTNIIAGYLGPILLNIQPVVLFMLCQKYLQNGIFNYNFMFAINLIYAIYVFIKYNDYLNSGTICTGIGAVNLDWSWNIYFSAIFYNVLMILNFVNFSKNKYISAAFIIAYIMLAMIMLDKQYSGKGEIWCYYATYILAIIFMLQKFGAI